MSIHDGTAPWEGYGEGQAQKKANERLITSYDTYAHDSLTDSLAIIARDVEDALVLCGAKAGKDYVFLDIFKMAIDIYCNSMGGTLTMVSRE